jgi:hypothetical protein
LVKPLDWLEGRNRSSSDEVEVKKAHYLYQDHYRSMAVEVKGEESPTWKAINSFLSVIKVEG